MLDMLCQILLTFCSFYDNLKHLQTSVHLSSRPVKWTDLYKIRTPYMIILEILILLGSVEVSQTNMADTVYLTKNVHLH